jgi:hypothetical protein
MRAWSDTAKSTRSPFSPPSSTCWAARTRPSRTASSTANTSAASATAAATAATTTAIVDALMRSA